LLTPDSYRLGGERWGPFLSWMTAWWNFWGWVCVVPGVQQGSTNFLLGAIEISYPDAEIVCKGWFAWLLTAIGMFVAMAPNIISKQRILRLVPTSLIIWRLKVNVCFGFTSASQPSSSSLCSCCTGSGELRRRQPLVLADTVVGFRSRLPEMEGFSHELASSATSTTVSM